MFKKKDLYPVVTVGTGYIMVRFCLRILSYDIIKLVVILDLKKDTIPYNWLLNLCLYISEVWHQ